LLKHTVFQPRRLRFLAAVLALAHGHTAVPRARSRKHKVLRAREAATPQQRGCQEQRDHTAGNPFQHESSAQIITSPPTDRRSHKTFAFSRPNTNRFVVDPTNAWAKSSECPVRFPESANPSAFFRY
jgi:hypothetical protein